MANTRITPAIEAAVDRVARALLNIGTAPAMASNASATKMAAPAIMGARPGTARDTAPLTNAAPMPGPAPAAGTFRLPSSDDRQSKKITVPPCAYGFRLPTANDTAPARAGRDTFQLPKE